MKRRLRTWAPASAGFALGTVMIAWANAAVPVAQEVPLEYRVKAAYLYNFVKYVEWPEPVDGTILICVAGQNPFGTVLDGLIKNERIHGVSLATRTILEFDPECDVIFAPKTSNIPHYLRGAAGMPILTVGETPRFIEQGGIVNFTVEDGPVRFEISPNAAERVKLRISSRLLQLARITEPGLEPR